ncbi:DUF3168 domain-containing protein [Aliarcobacter lanthieri]|uniref:DUF3168 domain-containing protein n=1 Tax=Aliarcobacter lanthieri TaxID=1355374 RepID=UPI003AB09453
MLEIDLYDKLKNDENIKTIVDTRIYPKVAPQNVKSPYIIYHEINGDGKQCIGGGIYQEEKRFQIDIWSTKYAETKQIRELVKESLLGFKSSFNIITRDDFDAESKLYREIIDFKLKG